MKSKEKEYPFDDYLLSLLEEVIEYENLREENEKNADNSYDS